MKKQTQFQSENILMSVLGHMVLLAVLMISFSVVVERAKLVTPNRIEIIEIDLKNVRVSGSETKLYNTSPLRQNDEEKNDKNAEEEKVVRDEKTELKQPTMVENESEKSTKEKTPKEEVKEEDKPAPRKKKLVRVNREVLSIDRTMTISVIDALRVALTRCWVVDTKRPGLEDIRLTAHIKFLPTGAVERLWFESESRAGSDPDFAYVLETAKDAIKTCSPFSMLPRNEYEIWRDTTVTFYPTSGQVM